MLFEEVLLGTINHYLREDWGSDLSLVMDNFRPRSAGTDFTGWDCFLQAVECFAAREGRSPSFYYTSYGKSYNTRARIFWAC